MIARTSGAVVITGCSSGIGRACALDLSRAGYRVFAGVRTEQDASSLLAEASTALVPLQLDVRDEDSIAAAARRVAEETGEAGLFALVNNAGVSASGPLEFLEVAELRNVLEVNLLGALRTVKSLLPQLRRGGGRIVNVGSGEAALATPANGAYCMSKFALEALTDTLRMEVAPAGVQVIAVEPGGTQTRILEKVSARFQEVRSSLPADGRDLYLDSIDARARMPEGAKLLAPESVARVIRRALEARRPKARYFAGLDVRGAFLLGRFVPAPARDGLLRLLFGFPGRRSDDR
jgi:NAD(P)-dependent dehydrogenase (short-subunit alcohol dehydrogenase family)